MNPVEWRSCDVVLDPQVVLSSHSLAVGGGPSSSKKCLLGRPRCEQEPSDSEDM